MSKAIQDKIDAAQRELLELRRALEASRTIQWLQAGAPGIQVIIDSGQNGPQEGERYVRRAIASLKPQIATKAAELAQADIDKIP